MEEKEGPKCHIGISSRERVDTQNGDFCWKEILKAQYGHFDKEGDGSVLPVRAGEDI